MRKGELLASLWQMTAVCTFAELLKEDTEGSKHGCPGHIKHGPHSLPLSCLKEGCPLCFLSANTNKLCVLSNRQTPGMGSHETNDACLTDAMCCAPVPVSFRWIYHTVRFTWHAWCSIVLCSCAVRLTFKWLLVQCYNSKRLCVSVCDLEQNLCLGTMHELC
jgi:hypothetical protein